MITKNKRGLFVVFEGSDGSGKTTMLEMLEKEFKERGLDYCITREPGGTSIGEQIRNLLLSEDYDKMVAETETLLYAASRAQHVREKIIPCLEEGKVVVSDRYVLSSVAYQGIGRNIGIEKIVLLNDFATGGLNPDITFFFDISPSETAERKKERNKSDRIENEDISYHNRVYNGYKEVLNLIPGKTVVLDATKDPDEIFPKIINSLDELLGR